MRLLDFLLGRNSGFYPFERIILENVKSRLNSEASFLFQRQIDLVNKVQRLADGKDVNFYHMVNGIPTFDDSLRLPHVQEEALLASVNVTVHKRASKLKADVWLVEGWLFSMEFDKPPKHFFKGVRLSEAQPEIVDLDIQLDHLRPN